MGTNNFTYIANFVAKSTYMYVICNTYIPRVYIKSLAHMHHLENNALAHMHRLVSFFRGKEESGIRIHEFRFTNEARFSNAKA